MINIKFLKYLFNFYNYIAIIYKIIIFDFYKY